MPHHFFQVDFLTPRVITAVVTQGNGKDNEWIATYRVGVSSNCFTWDPIRDLSGVPMVIWVTLGIVKCSLHGDLYSCDFILEFRYNLQSPLHCPSSTSILNVYFEYNIILLCTSPSRRDSFPLTALNYFKNAPLVYNYKK